MIETVIDIPIGQSQGQLLENAEAAIPPFIKLTFVWQEFVGEMWSFLSFPKNVGCSGVALETRGTDCR